MTHEELDSFEKEIYKLGYQAAQESEKVLKIDCVEIDEKQKQIKWKMCKHEPEVDLHDPIYHVDVVGTIVLGECLEKNVTIFKSGSKGIKLESPPDKTPSSEIDSPEKELTATEVGKESAQEGAASSEDTNKVNSTINETDCPKHETGTNKDSLSLKLDDGWLILDLCNTKPEIWANCVCVAASVHASVSNKVTVLPSGIREKKSPESKHETTEQNIEAKRKEMEDAIKKEGWKNVVHIFGKPCCTEKLTKQVQTPSVPVTFSNHTYFVGDETCRAGRIVGSVQFPSAYSCIIQLYNTKNCTDILWQEVLNSDEFSVNVKKLPYGSSCGPYKLRALIVSKDNSLLSEFESSEFEISRQNSPECIRQATETPFLHFSTIETAISEHTPQDKLQPDVVFSWKEPGYLTVESKGSANQPTEKHQEDYTYNFSGKLKENGLVLFDGTTQECVFKCQLKDLFEKHGIPLTESVKLLFEVTTLGDMKKLDSNPSVTEFIVLSPPTDIEISSPSEDFGIHLSWNFAPNAMSYLIKLVNTSTGMSKIARNHIPEQKMGKQYLKGTAGNEKYEFRSTDFESNENDDVFVVHTNKDDKLGGTKEEAEECTDTLALLNYTDLRHFLQMDPATYNLEMFSCGDGDKCIQSLTSSKSLIEEKIEILSSETVHLRFDYKEECFSVEVQANEVFSQGHVIDIIMETEEENATSLLTKCIVTVEDPDNTGSAIIRTSIKEWKIQSLHEGSKIVSIVSSVCPIEHKGVSCTLAKSNNTLEVAPPPSKVGFSIPSTTHKVEMKTENTSESLLASADNSSKALDLEPSDSTKVDLEQIPICEEVRPVPFSIILNTFDDLIVSHSNGDIVARYENGNSDCKEPEYFVGFVSKTKNQESDAFNILYRTYSSNRITIISLDELCVGKLEVCQLFMQQAGNKENFITSSFALCDQFFYCLEAEVRASRKWDLKTIRVLYPTISLVRILSVSVFMKSQRNSATVEIPLPDDPNHPKYQQHNKISFDSAASKQKYGYSTCFRIAVKLVRKLKQCGYAFVYQYDSISKKSEQYEYSVCPPSVPASKHTHDTTEGMSNSDNSHSGAATPGRLVPESTPVQRQIIESDVDAPPTNVSMSPEEPNTSSILPQTSEGTSQASKEPVPEVARPKRSTKPTSNKGNEKKSTLTTNKPPARSKEVTKKESMNKDGKVKPKDYTESKKDSKSGKGKPKDQTVPKKVGKGPLASQPHGKLKGKTMPKEQTPSKSMKDKIASHNTEIHEEASKDKSKQPIMHDDGPSEQVPVHQQSSMEQADFTLDSPKDIRPLTDHKTQLSLDTDVTPPTMRTVSEFEPGTEEQVTASDELSSEWEFVKKPSRELWFVLLSGKEKVKRQKGFDYKYINKCKELDDIRCWDQLAIELGLTAEQVGRITNMSKDLKKGEFADEWIKHDKKASWSKFIVALRSLELHKVASQIWRTYADRDQTTEGYTPMFYYDFIEMRKNEPIILTEGSKPHSSHLKSKHLNECLGFLPKNSTQRFDIAIHMRCEGIPNSDCHNRAWFRFKTTIQDEGYTGFRTTVEATCTCGYHGNMITKDGKGRSVSRTLFARNVNPKLSLQLTTEASNCKIVELLAIVVPQ